MLTITPQSDEIAMQREYLIFELMRENQALKQEILELRQRAEASASALVGSGRALEEIRIYLQGMLQRR